MLPCKLPEPAFSTGDCSCLIVAGPANESAPRGRRPNAGRLPRKTVPDPKDLHRLNDMIFTQRMSSINLQREGPLAAFPSRFFLIPVPNDFSICRNLRGEYATGAPLYHPIRDRPAAIKSIVLIPLLFFLSWTHRFFDRHLMPWRAANSLTGPFQSSGFLAMDASNPGLTIVQAKERNRRTYPEFGQQGCCKLVVLALEVGSRWNPDPNFSSRFSAWERPRPYHPALHGPMPCKAP